MGIEIFWECQPVVCAICWWTIVYPWLWDCNAILSNKHITSTCLIQKLQMSTMVQNGISEDLLKKPVGFLDLMQACTMHLSIFKFLLVLPPVWLWTEIWLSKPELALIWAENWLTTQELLRTAQSCLFFTAVSTLHRHQKAVSPAPPAIFLCCRTFWNPSSPCYSFESMCNNCVLCSYIVSHSQPLVSDDSQSLYRVITYS